MNDRFNRILQYDFSGLGCWLSFIAIALLASSVGLGWIINGFFILIALAVITPVIALFGLQWWLKRSFVRDNCPVCQYEFTGFKNSQFQCPSCNEPLQVIGGNFTRLTPPGTVDVDAVEVEVSVLPVEEED